MSKFEVRIPLKRRCQFLFFDIKRFFSKRPKPWKSLAKQKNQAPYWDWNWNPVGPFPEHIFGKK